SIFHDPSTTDFYTLSLHDALPISFEDKVTRLCTIPGVDRVTAWGMLAEIGLDMNQFPSSGHLASWACLCPGNFESAGKRLSGKMRKGNVSLRRCLSQAA